MISSATRGGPLLFLLLALAPSGAGAAASSYATIDEAAVAFVDLARTYPQQKNEYCAWLIKDNGGRVRFGTINEGDMDHCPSSWPKPAGTVGSVHTHPIWGPGSADVSSAGQVFSEGDFAHAEHADVSGRLPLNPGQKTALYDAGGKPVPKPSYCKDQ